MIEATFGWPFLFAAETGSADDESTQLRVPPPTSRIIAVHSWSTVGRGRVEPLRASLIGDNSHGPIHCGPDSTDGPIHGRANQSEDRAIQRGRPRSLRAKA
jgi:hypothetical protein